MTQQEQTISEVLARLLGRDPIQMTPSTSLQDQLGIDSTEMVDIVCALEQVFKIKLPDEAERSAKTIADLGRIVTAHQVQSAA